MVMEMVDEDMEESGMSCTDHPYNKNQTPGGICAFCLQDKLGKLVSSSFPSSIFPASAISSPNSRIHHDQHVFMKGKHTMTTTTTTTTFNNNKINTTNEDIINNNKVASIIFQRSKSTAVNRHRAAAGFWSFLSLNRVRAFPGGSGSGVAHSFRQRSLRDYDSNNNNNSNNGGGGGGENGDQCFSREDDERKVSRSRSVGCGSRSFSGDFFERISTGFGDCTLRRVESQREGGKTKIKNTPVHRASAGGDRVRCGGIFGGFSSSSSSSSSTTNWGVPSAVQAARAGHGRSRSWGWALASPMRVFSKPKRKASANVAPNLNAIPSILAVGG